MANYSNILQNRYDGNGRHAGILPEKMIKNKNFWTQMSEAEMESALVIEYIKNAIGKTRLSEVEVLFE